MVFQFDVNTGELLEKLPAPFEHLIMREQGGQIESPQNVPGVFDCYPNYYAIEQYDTLYHIDTKRNKILPFFTVEYNFPKVTGQPLKPKFFQLNKNMMVTTVYERINGFGSEKDFIIIDLKNKTSSRIKILNDYLGNIGALPDHTFMNFYRGYYVYSVQPEELMEDIEERLAERTCTEADREILKKTLSKLKEGTNNVLFIGKLKDEITTKLW